MISSASLAHFTGSETVVRWSRLFFKHWMTEGVKHVVDSCGAYWLLDAIASHHGKACRKDPRMADFQVWTLQKRGNGALLTGRVDSGVEPVARQSIEFTDFFANFSGDSFKLYVCRSENGWVVMLPTEY